MIDVTATHFEYDQMIATWEYLDDLYHGVDRWLELTDLGYAPTNRTQLFLPKHPGEDDENWRARINQSYYDDLFGKALRRYVDLSFRGGVRVIGDETLPFAENYDFISDSGQSGDLFFRKVALSALLYGCSYLMVDSNQSGVSYKDSIENPPYFVSISPQQLINWDTYYRRGQLYYSLAVIREEVFVVGGDYTHSRIDRYRVYTPGLCEIYHVVSAPGAESKKPIKVLTFETGLEFIPLVRVTAGYFPDAGFPLPPLRSLADKNRALYQKTSDHDRKVSLCCQPVAVLKDSMRNSSEPLVIGANSYIQIQDPTGSFKWEEPLSLSLQQSSRDIDKLATSIALDMANFLNNPSDRQSATATQLMISPVEANLESFIIAFCDGCNQAIAFYNSFSGYKPEVQNKISLVSDIFPDSNKDSQAGFAIQNMFINRLITRKTALQSLVSLGILPDDFDIESELLNEELLDAPGTGIGKSNNYTRGIKKLTPGSA
jgi:Domain of unknown function (DUF4055)